MGKVLDYETQPADFPTMLAHGVDGAAVYVQRALLKWPKAVTLGQLSAAEQAKFPLAFNFEQNPQDYLQGPAAGVTHGSSIEQAMKDLGLPGGPGQPVYLSIDTNVFPQQFPTAAAYFHAAQSMTTHPLDVYGTTALAEYLFSQGLIRRHWMSESRGFYGNATPGPHTVLIQNFGETVAGLGGSYDVNDVLQADWGQFPSPVRPVPAPTTIPLVGDNVKLTSIAIKTDAFGRGFSATTIPWNTFVSVTAQGSNPPTDGYWPNANASAQDRGNMVLVTVQGAVQNGTVTVYVAHTA